jgi:hypothetical protein
MTKDARDHLSARGFWSCARRASGRSRGGRPPFCASGGAMDFDVRAVDRHGPNHAGRAGQRVKDGSPDALAAPSIEAVVDRRVRSIVGRAIAPARARTQHVHDPADDSSIVDTVRAAPATWHQRFNPLPFRITQPIKLLPHQGLPESEALNHNSSRVGILIEYRPFCNGPDDVKPPE